MPIPTEPIGSIPRPQELLAGMTGLASGSIDQAGLDVLVDQAIADTVERLEAGRFRLAEAA